MFPLFFAVLSDTLIQRMFGQTGQLAIQTIFEKLKQQDVYTFSKYMLCFEDYLDTNVFPWVHLVGSPPRYVGSTTG